jgi:hypothetical protein
VERRLRSTLDAILGVSILYFMSRKQLIAIGAVLSVALLIFVISKIDLGSKGTTEEDKIDPVVSFFNNLPPQIKNCGVERNILGVGYNPSMRDCFVDAYRVCDSVKIQQELQRKDQSPIFTAVVIEGREARGCKAHFYTNELSPFGADRLSDTICFDVSTDLSSGQNSLLFNQCEDRTQRFLY